MWGEAEGGLAVFWGVGSLLGGFQDLRGITSPSLEKSLGKKLMAGWEVSWGMLPATQGAHSVEWRRVGCHLKFRFPLALLVYGVYHLWHRRGNDL